MTTRNLDLGLAAGNGITVLPDITTLPTVNQILAVTQVAGTTVRTGFVDPTAAPGGPFLPLSGGTLTGQTNTMAPLMGMGGVQVTPTPIGSPTAQFFVYQGAGSVSAASYRNIHSAIDLVTGSAPGSSKSFNTMQVSGDNSATAGNSLLELSYFFGGANFSGAVAGLTIGMNMNAASIPPVNTFYMGANIFTTTGVPAGGTNTGSGSRGNWYGLNVAPELASGATNFTELTSCEIDSMVKTGASVSRRVNLKLCLQSAHAVQGAVQDAFLEFGMLPGSSVGSLKGLIIGGLEGLFPLDNTNGVAIGHEYSVFATAGINPQVKTYIDASHIRTLTAHWLSPGASIDGSGNYTSGPGRLSWSSTGASLDVFGQTGGTPTITAGGTGAVNGQVVTTGNGDLYTVTASGGAITGLAPIVAATSRTTGPTASQTIQGDGITGATCTIPWTNAQALALQPSGGITNISGPVNTGGLVSMFSGASFGSAVAPAGALDLSKHLALFGTIYGLNVTAGAINVVVGGALAGTFLGGTFVAANAVQIGGATGPTWTTGSAAPAATAPVGSLYSRVSTWAAGATLYVSKGGGAWTAVANV